MVGQYIFVGRNTGVLPKGTLVNRCYDGRNSWDPHNKEIRVQTEEGTEHWVKVAQLRRTKPEMFTQRFEGF